MFGQLQSPIIKKRVAFLPFTVLSSKDMKSHYYGNGLPSSESVGNFDGVGECVDTPELFLVQYTVLITGHSTHCADTQTSRM